MRTSLRRSCHACAKAKLRCDLQTPRCSRCARRKASCVYANQPLTSSSGPSVSPNRIEDDDFRTPKAGSESGETSPTMTGNSISLVNPATSSFDPFDSYPPTRLSRTHVQRLIHHCMSTDQPRQSMAMGFAMNANGVSSFEYRLPILSAGHEHAVESFRLVVVAPRTRRSRTFSCLSADCVSR